MNRLQILVSEFSEPQRLDAFVKILGQPSRVFSGKTPAPVGHRNNHLHFYDDLGLYLHEHHATYLIGGVCVVFEPGEAFFPTTEPFTGELYVAGQLIQRGMTPKEILAASPLPLRGHLGHSLVVDGERFSFDIETYALKTPSGRKSTKRLLSQVSIGFKNSHRIC